MTSIAWLDDATFATSSNDTTLKVWNPKEEEALIKTLRVAENPNEINEMQVGITSVSGDLYSLSLFGALNQWKGVSSLTDGSLPTNRFHGHNTLVACMT